MSELVFELEEFSHTKKALISMKEGLDLSSAAGRMQAHILAAMANFERDRIAERTLMGLARARAHGRILGRHPVGCGCGTLDKHGNRHNGPIKPIRNQSHQIIGWDAQEQTPQEVNPLFESEPQEKQPPV